MKASPVFMWNFSITLSNDFISLYSVYASNAPGAGGEGGGLVAAATGGVLQGRVQTTDISFILFFRVASSYWLFSDHWEIQLAMIMLNNQSIHMSLLVLIFNNLWNRLFMLDNWIVIKPWSLINLCCSNWSIRDHLPINLLSLINLWFVTNFNYWFISWVIFNLW